MVHPHIPVGRGDWTLYFRPAIKAMLSGQSPFTIPGYYNPPWTLLPLIPLSFVPTRIGAAIIVILHPFLFTYISYKLGAKPLVALAVGLSWPVLLSSISTNIEFMPFLGLLLPPQLGLFFFLTKPQMGIGPAIFLVVMAWRKEKTRGLIKLLLPITSVTIFSLLLYGFWPIDMMSASNNEWNISLWPWSIPIGVLIIYITVHKNNFRGSAVASPFFSPYITASAPSALLIAALSSAKAILVLFVLSWVWAYLIWFS
jgi:hypothetical protein